MTKKIILVSGYYNPLHGGHLSNMKEAKKLGDELWVVVNNDKQQMLKKGGIILDEKERMEIVSELKCVNKVVLAVDEDNAISKTLGLVAEQNPGCEIIFAKGGDRNPNNLPKSELEVCKKYNIKIVSEIGIDKVNSSSRINKLSGGNLKQEK